MALRKRSHRSPDAPARQRRKLQVAETHREAFYRTRLGQMVLGDALDVLPQLSPQSVDLIMTSPPFGLVRKKGYGNADADEYVDWFRPFAKLFKHALKDSGSLVIDIGG